MRTEQKRIVLDTNEEGVVIEGLNKVRTEQLAQDGAADFVSDLMLKIIRTPQRKKKVRDEAR